MMKHKGVLTGIFGVLLVFGLVLVGCSDASGGGSSFVPVTDITDIPVIAVVGAELTLSGTVKPANATNKTITWSGDNVTNSVFKATASGESMVTATIANGKSESSPYIKTFTIKVYRTGTDPGTGTVANVIDDLQGTWTREVPEEGYTLKMTITDMDWTINVTPSGGSEIPDCKGIIINVEGGGTYKAQQEESYGGGSWHTSYRYEEGTYSFSDDKNELTLALVPPYSDSASTGTWTKQP